MRSASVTNSSISLPTCLVMPRTMLPAACSGVCVPVMKAGGLRNACRSGIFERGGFVPVPTRSTVSVSIECPKRYTALANSPRIEGLMLVL